MKPSWQVTKLIECEGERPERAVEVGAAGEARGQRAGDSPASPRTKWRTSSRKRPFHSAQRPQVGKVPTW